jgi:hypothetical protein
VYQQPQHSRGNRRHRLLPLQPAADQACSVDDVAPQREKRREPNALGRAAALASVGSGAHLFLLCLLAATLTTAIRANQNRQRWRSTSPTSRSSRQIANKATGTSRPQCERPRSGSQRAAAARSGCTWCTTTAGTNASIPGCRAMRSSPTSRRRRRSQRRSRRKSRRTNLNPAPKTKTGSRGARTRPRTRRARAKERAATGTVRHAARPEPRRGPRRCPAHQRARAAARSEARHARARAPGAPASVPRRAPQRAASRLAAPRPPPARCVAPQSMLHPAPCPSAVAPLAGSRRTKSWPTTFF